MDIHFGVCVYISIYIHMKYVYVFALYICMHVLL